MEVIENLDKYIDLIGKDIYTFEHVWDGHPYIVARKIHSVEVFNTRYIVLKTANEGNFMADGYNKYYFPDRELAEKKLIENYSAEVVDTKSLRKCPLCDGIPQIMQYNNNYYIECKDCGLRTKDNRNLKEALNLWNSRK